MRQVKGLVFFAHQVLVWGKAIQENVFMVGNLWG